MPRQFLLPILHTLQLDGQEGKNHTWDKIKKYMRDMGVKDAWIVPFKDGQRVDIKDVLEGVVADKTPAK